MRVIWVAIASALALGGCDQPKSLGGPLTARVDAKFENLPSPLNPEDESLLHEFVLALGSAQGCGLQIEAQHARLTSWLARKVSEPTVRVRLEEEAHRGIMLVAEQQAKGQSPDSCSVVGRNLTIARLS